MSFPAYAEYKDSGVAWLGEVPAHWVTRSGRRLYSQKRDAALETDEQLSATQKYGVVPQRLFMELEDQKVSLALSGLGSFKHVEADDFVISLRSFQGGIERSKYSGCVSPAYTVLRPQAPVDAQFMAYVFKSAPYISTLQSVTDGIRDGKNISYEQFGQISLPYPSIHEQTAIAAFLDRETAKIDALIAEQEKLIILLKEKRQAVISHAVTKGLNPDAPMKDSGVEWLGEVPAHWTVTPIKHVGWLKAGAGFPHDEQGLEGEEIEFHKVSSLGSADSSSYLPPPENTISRATATKLGAWIFGENTIVFAKVGAALLLGRVRFLKRPSCIDNNMMGLTVFDTQHECRFIRYAMELIRFDLIANPGAVPSINEGQIGNFSTATCPRDEQILIANYLNRMTTDLDALIVTAESAISLLKERRAALISAAVTGKIKICDEPVAREAA